MGTLRLISGLWPCSYPSYLIGNYFPLFFPRLPRFLIPDHNSDRSQEANIPKEEGSESERLAQIKDERGQRGPPDATPLSRDGSH